MISNHFSSLTDRDVLGAKRDHIVGGLLVFLRDLVSTTFCSSFTVKLVGDAVVIRGKLHSDCLARMEQ
ncbi:hypothetical protein AWU82_29815 [Pseudomonas glycinae]|uniref:BON domain-containing protein n=1 Tax=Pseudomonas glycinae TaxID=1785145 RepID=A0ABM6QI63_9PSED|nr:hypothetical protein AWU82_29815 [Pseudomonas glycinae]